MLRIRRTLHPVRPLFGWLRLAGRDLESLSAPKYFPLDNHFPSVITAELKCLGGPVSHQFIRQRSGGRPHSPQLLIDGPSGPQGLPFNAFISQPEDPQSSAKVSEPIAQGRFDLHVIQRLFTTDSEVRLFYKAQ